MIIFDLQCACGCQFEGWFESRADFDRQTVAGLIACPDCRGREIHKILSPVPFHSGAPDSMSPSHEDRAEVSAEEAVQFLRSVQEIVEKHFEDVGAKLAEESLKIHYGLAEPRNIRGFTTAGEEKMLLDEGIELLKIPLVRKNSDPKLN